jgi:hypothetical protein
MQNQYDCVAGLKVPTILCNHCYHRYYVVKFKNMYCCKECYIRRVTIQQDARFTKEEADNIKEIYPPESPGYEQSDYDKF